VRGETAKVDKSQQIIWRYSPIHPYYMLRFISFCAILAEKTCLIQCERLQVATPFDLLLIMGPPVHEAALHRAHVILPLLLQVDQRPLPPAEHEVLQSRQHDGLMIVHPMRMQVTPSGSVSSTSTV